MSGPFKNLFSVMNLLKLNFCVDINLIIFVPHFVTNGSDPHQSFYNQFPVF